MFQDAVNDRIRVRVVIRKFVKVDNVVLLVALDRIVVVTFKVSGERDVRVVETLIVVPVFVFGRADCDIFVMFACAYSRRLRLRGLTVPDNKIK